MWATDQALKDSGIEVTEENQYDIGCIVGTGIGGIDTLTNMVLQYDKRGRPGVSPRSIPQMLSDSVSSRITIEYGIRGANFDITSACATGNNCIGNAADMIRLGRAQMMLAGGSEACVIDMVLSGFGNMKAMTTWDDEPTKASRPFDLNRTGFVAAEGAAVLVLEELDHALARNAKIYGELVGYGHTSDGYHVTAPLADGSSMARAIDQALNEAGLQPTDIDYVNAHGTSTSLNDTSETMAIKMALGEHAYAIPVSSTKSMTGHMLGAAGAVEAVFSLMAIRDNFAPPTINLETPDPTCDLDYVPNVGREHPINTVLSNSAGFGGHNTPLIFKRYENGSN